MNFAKVFNIGFLKSTFGGRTCLGFYYDDDDDDDDDEADDDDDDDNK